MLQHILPCRISAAGTLPPCSASLQKTRLCPALHGAQCKDRPGTSHPADPDPRVLQPLGTDTLKATPGCRREVWGACRGLSLNMHRRSFLCMQRTHTTTSTASGGRNIQNQCSPPARAAPGAQQEFGCSGRLLNSEARPKKCSLFRPGLGKIIQHKC